MKRVLVLSVLTLPLLAMLAPTAAAQDPTKSSYEFEMYHVVLAKHGPNWKPQHTEEGMDVRMQVVSAVRKASAEGLIVAAGLVNDETDVEFIIIMRVETKAEALELMNNSPNVKNGFFKPEIYSWFAPKGLTTAPPRSMAPKAAGGGG
jgi:uncharacterized protein YciI